MNEYTYTHMHKHMHTHTHAHTHTHTCHKQHSLSLSLSQKCMYLYTQTRARAHTHTHAPRTRSPFGAPLRTQPECREGCQAHSQNSVPSYVYYVCLLRMFAGYVYYVKVARLRGLLSMLCLASKVPNRCGPTRPSAPTQYQPTTARGSSTPDKKTFWKVMALVHLLYSKSTKLVVLQEYSGLSRKCAHTHTFTARVV
jgi:hypothetical protein